jgi:methionyl-tRNA synthetase
MSKPKYYLTTPVFDAAFAPQIGFVYTAILCDAIARHKRMCGFDVAHFIGMDTHGVSLSSTEKQTETPRGSALRQNCRRFEELLNLVDVHCTHFRRTPSPEHILAIDTLVRRTMRRSRLAIYKNRYQGRYCLQDQIDVSESAEPADCPICKHAATLISEERYFFRLSDFQDRLTALYKYRPELIQPQVRLDTVAGFLAKGLKDIPISRGSTGGGVPWPDDSDHIVLPCYAELAGYLSSIGFGEGGYGSDEFKKYWPANLHVIDKNEFWPHAILWPAFLMAADLPLPRHIFAHGTIHFEREGTNKAFFPDRIVQLLGSDAVRYYLLREVGYGEDAHVDCDGLVRAYNPDLAEVLANLSSRILTLVGRHCDGKIPGQWVFSGIDWTLEIDSADIRAEARFLLDHFDFSGAIKKIWSLLAIIEKSLKDNARLEFTDNPGEKHHFINILQDACQGLGWIALLLFPILPRAAEAIWRGLGQTTLLEDEQVDNTPWTCLMSGTPIGRPETLFPRINNVRSLVS